MRCENEERKTESILYLIFDFVELIFQAIPTNPVGNRVKLKTNPGVCFGILIPTR